MKSRDEECAEFRRLDAIDAAFREGNLDALRAALEDASAVPNGRMPDTIGPCLVYAIYHSPLPFIRELLELGADPNGPADDGFPPLIAALATGRSAPGVDRRDGVDGIVRLLLKFGVDPNQRGINDYTPLHIAVAERNGLAVQRLLDGGADPDLRTRIDECETPLEMARAAGLSAIATVLERRGQPLRQRLRSGLTLLWDAEGTGEVVRRQQVYRLRLSLWLHHGGAVRWTQPDGFVDTAVLEDDGATLVSDQRIDRRSLIAGLFYGIDGMRVGGTRCLEIAPHLAYGERGIPGTIPENSVVRAEVGVIGARRGAAPGGATRR